MEDKLINEDNEDDDLEDIDENTSELDNQFSVLINFYRVNSETEAKYRIVLCNLFAHKKLNEDFLKIKNITQQKIPGAVEKITAMMLLKCNNTLPSSFLEQVKDLYINL